MFAKWNNTCTQSRGRVRALMPLNDAECSRLQRYLQQQQQQQQRSSSYLPRRMTLAPSHNRRARFHDDQLELCNLRNRKTARVLSRINLHNINSDGVPASFPNTDFHFLSMIAAYSSAAYGFVSRRITQYKVAYTWVCTLFVHYSLDILHEVD